MSFYRIVQVGDDVLRKKAVEVRRFNHILAQLLDDMTETLHEADGVGLAAPQVGVSKRVVVVDIGEGLIELVNPVVLSGEGRQVDYEACLSVPDCQGQVARFQKVKVQAQDRYGKPFTMEAEGFLSRAFQHEIDHLDGILFIDKMEKPEAN